MEQQEAFIKLQMIQQESVALEEKLQMIDHQIQEMQAIQTSIAELERGKDEKREILANLGKGIFIKTEVKEDKVFVNVGKDIVVRKTAKEAREILDDQVRKLVVGKEDIMARIEELQAEMRGIIGEAQKAQAQGVEKGKEKSEKKDK